MSHPYIYPSRVLVYSLINEINGTRYNPTDVRLENVRPSAKGGDFRNTAVDVVGVEEEGFFGSVTVRYRRLDLGEVFSLCDLQVPWKGESSTLELIASINKQYGTVITSEDIELSYFNPNVLPKVVTITAKDDSLAWLGSVSVTVIDYVQSLPDAIQQSVLPIFDYPTGQSAKGQGTLYLRPYLFDNYWSLLRRLVVGKQSVVDSNALVTMINSVVPSTQQWTLSNAASARNLRGDYVGTTAVCSVLYAGEPTLQYTHRLGVERIVVLQLSPTLNTGYFGYLVMHYNDPTKDLDDSLVNKDIGRITL